MHIKKIVIQGFKTYRNTTEIDSLSPNLNVVVGRNGSGKSNFFSAIRFVLSDAYSHLTREERQGLIHEGSGTVMSAYVEIIFDNTDRRFPIQKNEIAIRRTIGLKKDDYSMDGKSATRSDIMNLLESAGFSKLNPYYIVPQGQIISLTNAKDSERLALLKEVSGAKMFESKLKESNREMTNANFKMERVDEAMGRLDEKLSDLQTELNELKEYQQLQKSKKIFEFNLFDRELAAVNEQMAIKKEEYEQILLDSRRDFKVLETREKACQNLQLVIDNLEASLKVAQLENTQSELDHTKLLQTIAEKEVFESNLSTLINSHTEEDRAKTDKLDSYAQLIQEKESELLDSLRPQLEKLQGAEHELKNKIATLTTKQNLLYAKQSRFLQFASKRERNKWLNEEIKNLEVEITLRHEKMKELNVAKDEQRERLARFEGRIDELRTLFDDSNAENQVAELEEVVKSERLRIMELLNKRKALWRQEIKLKSLLDSAEHELDNAKHKVIQSMDIEQAKGIEAVQEIAEKLNLQDSVYGPLVELFSVSDKYKTAVEVVAGNSLFHVVVDTDETALTLMKELARTKAGRVTFMPLNRIHVPPVTFPSQEEHEYIPLIKKLKHNADLVGKAVQQVFGKTIVCNNLQKGSELAQLYRLNAITLDGDRASTQGILSGGFRNYKTSRLDNLKLQSKKKKELKKFEEELKLCDLEISEMTQEINRANEILEARSSQLETQQSTLETAKSEFSRLLNEKFAAEKEQKLLQISVENYSTNVKGLESRIEQYKDEVKSDFTQALTPEESDELSELLRSIASVEDEYNKVVTDSSSLETQISEVEDAIENYRAHVKQFERAIDQNESKEKNLELESIKQELEQLKALLAESEQLREEHSNKEVELQQQLAAKRSELDEANAQQIAIVKRLEVVGKKAEKFLSNRAILDNRREELQEKINDLGVLPEEAFQKSNFENLTLDELLSSLNTVNNELKRYAHINKKAMEQLNTIAREKDELVARKLELEESKVSIEKLVESLELQKDTAIRRSFDEVSRSFSEIFEKLVPVGRGQLVMRAKEDATSEEDLASIENYVGVSILVSFNSKEDEQQRISQLSGGQKSLCAIALILAIQRCDPAPFYLFDEIDANLDTQYRTAVASLILKLADLAQFICTTFRPEMIQVANNCYGVSFSNKVSTVLEIPQEDALTFVEGQRT